MKVDKMRALSAQDLAKQIDETQQELFNLRFRLATRQLTDYSELRKARRKLARMKTILREKELVGG